LWGCKNCSSEVSRVCDMFRTVVYNPRPYFLARARLEFLDHESEPGLPYSNDCTHMLPPSRAKICNCGACGTHNTRIHVLIRITSVDTKGPGTFDKLQVHYSASPGAQTTAISGLGFSYNPITVCSPVKKKHKVQPLIRYCLPASGPGLFLWGNSPKHHTQARSHDLVINF